VTVVAFMLLGSFSFIGIGMIAAILPLLYVERGAQMTFVLQSCLLLVSGVYYSIDVLPGWMQVLSHVSPATYVLDGRPQGPDRRRAGHGAPRRCLAAARHGRVPDPVRAVGVRAGGALCQADRQAQAGRLTMSDPLAVADAEIELSPPVVDDVAELARGHRTATAASASGLMPSPTAPKAASLDELAGSTRSRSSCASKSACG